MTGSSSRSIPDGTDPTRDAFGSDAYAGGVPDPSGAGAYPGPSPQDDLRRRAIDRLHRRRGLWVSVIWWAIISVLMVWIWWLNRGFFWPIFPIGAWGIGIVYQFIEAYGRGDSEERIQAEMRRLGGSGR